MSMSMPIRAAFVSISVMLIVHSGSSRFITEKTGLLSNGMNQSSQYSSALGLRELRATTVTCTPTYGFLPCTTELWGELFLLVVYEYLLSLAQQYVTTGSDLFFKMFGTGIFGASLFQMLGMFPQIIVVLVSGVSASEDSVETMAVMGMSMLAGSTIMNLTLIWGSVVAFGSYDLSDTSSSSTSSNPESGVTSVSSSSTSASSTSQNKKPFSLTGYGVTIDIQTRYTAGIMLLSLIPFLILQLATILNSSTATRVLVLISLIITLVFLISYCTYQVFKPWIQTRRLEYLMLRYLEENLLHRLLTIEGKPNEAEIKRLFHKIDKNNNSAISSEELRALILGIQIEEVGLDKDDFEKKVMEEFDISGDSTINETEFTKGLSIWLSKANSNVTSKANEGQKLFLSKTKRNGEEQQSLLSTTKTESKTTLKTWWNYTKAAFFIILGTAISFVLGTPLMETIQNFSSDANIPSFLISYVVIPLALSFRQVFAVIKSAKQKTEKAASLTFSELYGAVFMSNVMGLTTFLALVYIRDISWDVSAEILAVLVICLAMGLFASFSTKIPFWTCILVYLLYPLSLVLLYVLTNVLGWS